MLFRSLTNNRESEIVAYGTCNDLAEVDRKIELCRGRFAFALKDNQRMSHVQCVRKKKKQTLQKLLLVL